MGWLVEKGNCDVYYPKVEDRSEQKDLQEMAKEKSKDPIKVDRPKSNVTKEERKEQIRELREFKARQRGVNTRKYY